MAKGNDLEYDVHFSFQLKKCPFCIQTKIISVFCMSILSMTISTITGPDLDHQKNVFKPWTKLYFSCKNLPLNTFCVVSEETVKENNA